MPREERGQPVTLEHKQCVRASSNGDVLSVGSLACGFRRAPRRARPQQKQLQYAASMPRG
eukprot:2370039-Rhodomonas_salina.1